MYGNQYYNQPRYQQQGITPQYMTPMPPIMPQQNNQMSLLGKSVDSIEVVKAMDIPLDGSVSYFPLTDGSAIVTKQLQNDGTSKTIIFKPVEANNVVPRYITPEELEKALEKLDFSELEDFKDELEEIKKQIKEIKKLMK